MIEIKHISSNSKCKILFMKKLLVISAALLLINVICDAQYWLNMDHYDYRSYRYQSGDPYHPAGAGIASFFIPGLGQMICSEWARGAVFLTGWLGGIGMVIAGMSIQANTGEGADGMGLVYLGLGFSTVSWIWSIGDAVRVARVNNMVFRDKYKNSASLQLKPYIGFQNYPAQDEAFYGLSVSISF